ncbi:MAG TPA: hypothetical protein VN682_07125 [Terriglobales bacterium]|nr:hypothetical protein [Terriglobales bacterium]
MSELPKRYLTEAGRNAANQLSVFSLHLARPFFWHSGARNGSVPEGASAFILQFEDRYIGVTADHVVAAYREAKAADSRTICQLGTSQIHPESEIIARSAELDIATFAIDPVKLQEIGANTVDCRGQWPPPPVEVGDVVTLTGFLNNHRVKKGPQHYEMIAWGGHGVADAVTDRDIVSVYEPDNVLQPDWAVKKPPLGFNLSGCSGVPVALIKDIKGLLRWFPVGMIYKGPGDNAKGVLAGFDRIHARRLSFLQSDGSIKEPNQGWLPS